MKKPPIPASWLRLTAVGRVKGAAVLVEKLANLKSFTPAEQAALERVRVDLDVLASEMKGKKL